MSMVGLFNRRVDQKRKTSAASTVSAAGTVTWSVVRHGIACRIWTVGSSDLVKFGKATGEMSHVLMCGPHVGIKSWDLLSEGSVIYDIAGPPQPVYASRRLHHYEVALLERIES